MGWREYVRDGPDAAGDSSLDRVIALCLWHRVWAYTAFLLVSVVVAWTTPITPWFWGYCIGAITVVVGARIFNVESLQIDPR
ncbi:hypothetical protein [Salinigranum salinum]|uniref:hypothetical protein n=1 Tax=Salinigranum salinum TaxID=1364937 RepID=UPI0012607A7C|nr:hypothetical protein [Salinigranum salinum]